MKYKAILSSLSIALFSLSLAGCNDNDNQENVVSTPKQPNILFIMADDLGYSDLGAFGGEIHTPNIDSLAQEGRLLTDYHTAPTCSPTRSQLISGTDHHLAGIGAMAELTPEHLKGQPGYEGYLNERSLSIAQVLKDNGYGTYISGKWHLGLTPETNAHAKGFDHSFTLLQGLDHHFKQALSAFKRNSTYTEDGAEGFVRGGYGSESGFDNSLANVGTPTSYHYIGPRWAEVSAAPFHLWKDTADEGATIAPAIVKLPNQKKAEETNHSFASVLDVFPTLLEYAHIPVPQGQYNGRTINTPTGISWKPLLENKTNTIRPANFSFADELHGSKYAKQGEWKIALQGRPELGTGTWELYNIKLDRGERQNVAQLYPAKVQELLSVYQKYTEKNAVQEYNPK
ncbi:MULTISPECIES: sulfatase-like hydrolase/transferase [Acinetobacter]|uniref:sulfatase-like hydrolase/transferase n=1 Tax=Acinetobacter TaxID=469 RepID=UPI001478F569|nr:MULTISPECIES: sulfatase-like hydrolase/transferase [Acinetobacter]MDQ9949653.1 sulfatase-like hydrolase/transferase [Acinetobacter sp. 12966]